MCSLVRCGPPGRRSAPAANGTRSRRRESQKRTSARADLCVRIPGGRQCRRKERKPPSAFCVCQNVTKAANATVPHTRYKARRSVCVSGDQNAPRTSEKLNFAICILETSQLGKYDWSRGGPLPALTVLKSEENRVDPDQIGGSHMGDNDVATTVSPISRASHERHMDGCSTYRFRRRRRRHCHCYTVRI
jgi:hypothetical protein